MGYTHGIKWTEESIENALMKVVRDLELDRMPSCKEVEKYYGNCCLTNAISKRIGWYALAERLGLPIKESETYFGKRQEKSVQEEIIARGHEVRKMPQNFPYDLLVDDCIKIDVKASRLFRGCHGNFYAFNLEKPFCTCDIYVLRLLKDNSDLIGTLIVPSKDVPTNTQISVGEKHSKYYKYRDRWDYIEEYSRFFESVG